jgi:hypothetical protein
MTVVMGKVRHLGLFVSCGLPTVEYLECCSFAWWVATGHCIFGEVLVEADLEAVALWVC